MIKRTIEISQEPAHLAVRNDQLRLLRDGDQPGQAPSIPCEDIGLVIVDHPQCSYSHHALSRLIDFGAGLVVCGRSHLPTGMLVPLADHTQVVRRIHDQINASKPCRKNLWKQIVIAKIEGQARNLPERSTEHGRLINLARDVRSGDPDNTEAQAARIYWSAWLTPIGITDFRREKDGSDPVNVLLNYGYSIYRAAVARAIVAGGLFPALGIHHHNRSNAFCLADDLLEPLRPIIDSRVRLLIHHGNESLNTHTKAALLDRLTATVQYGDQSGPLMVALHKYVASLAECLAGESRKLVIPAQAERDRDQLP